MQKKSSSSEFQIPILGGRPSQLVAGPGLACVCFCPSRANEEIAQVRSKAQGETLAFQASLRKAQMQIHSLEKTVEQKVRHRDPGPCSGS